VKTSKISHSLLFPTTTNTLNDCLSQYETWKKNSTNLEQLDYLQDLNRLLLSNVVDQAAEKTECYLAYYMGEVGNKQASSSCKLTGIHKFSSAPGRFLQLISTDMSLMDSMIQMRSEGIFTRAL
jgi:hypothetical protein